MSNVLEMMMLFCFGFSWPISLVKSIRSKTAASTSLSFILLIITGYAFGIGAKLISGNTGYVLAVYLINLIVVLVNLVVYFRNRNYDKTVDSGKERKMEMPALQASDDEAVMDKVLDYEKRNEAAVGTPVVFFGSGAFSRLPVEEYGMTCQFDYPLYNRSIESMTIDDACVYAARCLHGLHPGKIVLGFGEENDSTSDAVSFLKKYEWLLYNIHLNTKAELLLTLMPEVDDIQIRNGIRKLASEYGYTCVQLYGNSQTHDGQAAILHQLRSYLRTYRISFEEAMRIGK